MKERIAAAIEKKLEESPGNLNLEQQASLIHSAMITTVHKFCLSVIRDHFHVIGIDPSFRVGEEGELRLLKQDVLDEMLEEHYAKDEEEFREFVEKYGTGRTDKKIEELILQLYEYSRSYPDPRQWLISCAEDYEIDREHLEDSRMVHTVEERVRQQLGDLYGLVRQAMEICQLPAGPYMYAEALESDEKELKKLEVYQNNQPVYEAIVAALSDAISAQVYLSPVAFMPVLTKVLTNVTADKKLLEKIADGLSVMDKSAEIQRDRKGNVLYDKETKDTEIVKWDESIEDYMAREVLPHIPDAVAFFEENLDAKKPVVKTGAEIPFTRYFYKYQQPVPSEELEAKFMELELSVSERVAKLFE